MLYNVSNPTEYLNALEEDWRKNTLLELRSMILSKAPEIEESIEYKMLRFGNAQQTAFHLNAQKNYVSLYVGDTTKVDEQGDLLKGLDIGKGCIRIKKSVTIADTQLEAFIDKALSMWRAGANLDC